MADNDRFVIKKVSTIDCYKCKHKIEDCEDIECPKEEGKTRAEYEDMIAESIYNHTISIYENSYNGLNPNELEKIEEESKDLAKAVVDRLFGEGL